MGDEEVNLFIILAHCLLLPHTVCPLPLFDPFNLLLPSPYLFSIAGKGERRKSGDGDGDECSPEPAQMRWMVGWLVLGRSALGWFVVFHYRTGIRMASLTFFSTHKT